MGEGERHLLVVYPALFIPFLIAFSFELFYEQQNNTRLTDLQQIRSALREVLHFFA